MRINQLVWQHGALVALIYFIISLVAYIIGLDTLVGWPIGVAQSLLIFITMIVVSRSIREDENGTINFLRLFGHIMISVVSILFASLLFNILLFNIIDPALIDSVVEITLERVEGMMKSFGIEGDFLQETLDETELEIRKGYTLGGALKTLIVSSAFWGLIALIIAAIFKRNQENKINF